VQQLGAGVLTFPAWHVLPLGLLLVVATSWDLAKQRIPNPVVAAVAVFGLVVQVFDRGILSAASGLAAASIVIALLYFPWTLGGIGGGDVKLAAAVAIWVGLGAFVRFALAVAVAGGLVAAVRYFFLRAPDRKEVRANLTLAALGQGLPSISQRGPGRVVPYGLAIGLGAFVALWKR
jgi:prepilin peptidase CpaA